jgi:hypothetical protein
MKREKNLYNILCEVEISDADDFLLCIGIHHPHVYPSDSSKDPIPLNKMLVFFVQHLLRMHEPDVNDI